MLLTKSEIFMRNRGAKIARKYLSRQRFARLTKLRTLPNDVFPNVSVVSEIKRMKEEMLMNWKNKMVLISK